MTKIAVVDDDPAFAGSMAELVESYPGWGKYRPVIFLFSSAEEFLEAAESEIFDLAILDVVMSGRSGMEAAKLIYDRRPGTTLAFVSSSADHASQGYGVDAVAYLLKPVSPESVHGLLEEVIKRRARRHRQFMLLKTGRTTFKINLAEVVYLESDNKRVNFYSQKDFTVHVGKLVDFLSQLPPNFVQIHQSYAVNLDHMRAMRTSEMVTGDGRSIPISRRFRRQTEQRYLAHVAEGV